MEIEWVDDKVVDVIKKGSRKEGATNTMREMYQVLKENPNVWAKFPTPIAANASVARWKEIFPGLEAKVTGGNQLSPKDPNKKWWTVYVRYVEKG
jgi:hypothetical protein